MKSFSPPSKQKSMSLCNTFRTLSSGNFVYSVENSNTFIDLAAFLEFNLLSFFGTGLLLCTTQKLLTPETTFIIIRLYLSVKISKD